METKSSIRKQILKLRNEIPAVMREEYSRIIKDKLLTLDCISKAEHVLCFAGYQSEVHTLELMDELFSRGKNVYLPRVHGEDMEFYRIENLFDLQEGYKGILEPKDSCKDIFFDTQNPDTVMIMPGCVFARDGSRIGYGKGYYDRYLAKCDIMNRIALSFSAQIVDNIISDAHDKKASVIVTENEIIECRKV